jgi:hypothetical protein
MPRETMTGVTKDMGRTKRDGGLLGRMLGMLGGDTCLNKNLNKNSKFG